MIHHSTTGWSADRKLQRWNELISEVFVPLEQRPREPAEFAAELDYLDLGACRLASAWSNASHLQHTPRRTCRSSERNFILHMPIAGSPRLTQDGREATLSAGDLLLVDGALPYTLEFNEPCRMLVLVADAAEITRRLAVPSRILGLKLGRQHGVVAALGTSLRKAWDCVTADVLPVEAGKYLSSGLLDMFAAAALCTAGAEMAESSVLVQRRLLVRRYIDANLRNPNLRIPNIAAALKISPRYLYLLFGNDEETPCAYMLRRRLESIARQISEPQWRGHTITEIAFSWGFNNATHFARVFRERFGVSPREYRQRCCQDAGGPRSGDRGARDGSLRVDH